MCGSLCAAAVSEGDTCVCGGGGAGDEVKIPVISDTSCLRGEQGEIRYLFPLNERAHRPGLIGL